MERMRERERESGWVERESVRERGEVCKKEKRVDLKFELKIATERGRERECNDESTRVHLAVGLPTRSASGDIETRRGVRTRGWNVFDWV